MRDSSATVFISYSREDSAFVDRLEADLQARGIPTWMDRKQLQGGQEWKDQIQAALDSCRALLVVLTPDVVASRNARMEYRYALNQGKPVIPVMLKLSARVPMDLNDLQWVRFDTDYDRGLQDLLVALANLPASSATQIAPPVARANTLIGDEPVTLVESRNVPIATNPDLNALYREGVKARSDGDLEHAAVVWQQVLSLSPDFGDGSLANQMRTLNQQLRPARLTLLRQRAATGAQAGDWSQVVGTWRAYLGIDPMDMDAQKGLSSALRSQAEQAEQAGRWEEEIGAWEALLDRVPQDEQAQERLPVAVQCRKSAWHYDNARQFLNDGNISSASDELKVLWQEAPYYGDPEGVAPSAGLTTPPRFEEAKRIRLQRARVAQMRSRRRTAIFAVVPTLIAVVLVGSLFLAGLQGVGPLGSIVTTRPTPTASPPEVRIPHAGWQIVCSASNSYGLSYPPSWSIQGTSSLNGSGLVDIVFLTSGDNTLAQFLAGADPQITSVTTQDAVAFVNGFIQGETGDSSATVYPIAVQGVKVSGEKWDTYAVQLAVHGVSYSVVVYATVHNNSFYFIVVQAPQDQFNAVDTQAFGDIVNSITFLTPQSTSCHR